jgi:SanA protein
MRKALLILLVVVAAAVAILAGALTLESRASTGRLYSILSMLPHRRVGLVLGCSRRLGDGTPNPFFENRVRAAADLFHAEKVDFLLVSGDNRTLAYNEATYMQEALLHAGIPRERIYCDYAGFRTLDSMVRAHEVFGLSEVTVISQEFHNQRAIFLGAHHGVDAIGYNAADADPSDASGTRRREKLARIKAALDVYLLRTKPHFLGSKVAIGTDAPTTCAATR